VPSSRSSKNNCTTESRWSWQEAVYILLRGRATLRGTSVINLHTSSELHSGLQNAVDRVFPEKSRAIWRYTTKGVGYMQMLRKASSNPSVQIKKSYINVIPSLCSSIFFLRLSDLQNELWKKCSFYQDLQHDVMIASAVASSEANANKKSSAMQLCG